MPFAITELPAAFQETRRLNRFARAVDSTSSLVVQEDLYGARGNLLSGDFFKQTQILINTILAGKFASVPSMVTAILNEHVTSLRKNYDVVHNRLQVLSNILAEGLLASHIPGMSPQAVDQLRGAESASALEEETRSIFTLAEKLVSENAEDQDSVAQAVSYIDDHIFDRNLDVTSVCGSVQISVKRLSRMFQVKFDSSITDYINQRRIAVAKDLLMNSKLTIAQIAEQVGYNSSDTLARNFRKFEGVTPTEYRKLVLNNS